ncbi:hypothetical protein G7K_1454-t1 [Saitoella complicata NRRL Y-17804]|uniref:RNA-directed DNA polymerase n=1 Tax=Saitoella complicata (strain BCRC 22490 / CBS 7301 / JCM 7358 / NBRC 10748 / NRRL Y-17804) TaxID=698492 RepID=A0A0E9NBM8_SAICN|nr:hypothetical protein G7K_1454-t1 [Saitoella complicata NRRL Y-17804]
MRAVELEEKDMAEGAFGNIEIDIVTQAPGIAPTIPTVDQVEASWRNTSRNDLIWKGVSNRLAETGCDMASDDNGTTNSDAEDKMPDRKRTPHVLGIANRTPGVMILDTGAETYMISRGYAEKAGIKTRAIQPMPIRTATTTADDKKQFVSEVTEAVELQIGSIRMRKAFYVADAEHYDMLLGAPFFTQFNPTFDWAHQTVTLADGSRSDILPLFDDESDPEEEHPIEIDMIGRSGFKKAVRTLTSEEVMVMFLVETPSTKPKPNVGSPNFIMRDFGDVFPADLPAGEPMDRHVVHHIDEVQGATPQYRGIYRLSKPELDELYAQIQALLENGKIQPSVSPYGAPVLFVKKKDGKLRMCIDIRALNSQTIRNRYALPRIDEITDWFHGDCWFSKIDLKSGYYQIMIHHKDRFKTAFNTHYGHYEWIVMPFGLTNAPATFQTLMNDIFRDVLDKFFVVYLDDIMIYSRSKEEHEEHLRFVLNKLREHKLYANADKCEFFKTEVGLGWYLGHMISAEGVQPTEALTKAITKFPQPKTMKQLQSFVGLANYYRTFVEGYSGMVEPLTAHCSSSLRTTVLTWTMEMQHAFEKVKVALSTRPVLKIPDPEEDFEVYADASEDAKAIGAVLMQKGQPVAYESRKLNIHELNYPVHDKEMCAIQHAFTKWRHFLLGKPFKVYTDHRSLVYFKTQKHRNQRQLRWQEKAADYDCEILYKPGKTNVVADALSRIQIDQIHIDPQCPLSTEELKTKLRKDYLSRGEDAVKGIFKSVEEKGGETD